MNKYGPFFEILHDELEPTGYLGRGTHYSVFRAVVFHDATGKVLNEAHYHDFAVIWDEDHDERVFAAIQKVYQKGLLSRFVMFGERKGAFSAIPTPGAATSSFSLLEDQLYKLTSDLDGDSWPAHVAAIGTENCTIINDDDDKAALYLNNLVMLWQLGVKTPQKAKALRSKYAS